MHGVFLTAIKHFNMIGGGIEQQHRITLIESKSKSRKSTKQYVTIRVENVYLVFAFQLRVTFNVQCLALLRWGTILRPCGKSPVAKRISTAILHETCVVVAGD